MPPDENPTTPTNPQVPDQPPAPPAAATPPTPPPSVDEPDPAPAPAAEPPASSGAVLTIPRAAMTKLKREQREAGRKSAFDEITLQAKKIGFNSWEEALEAARLSRRKPRAGAPAAPSPEPTPPSAPSNHEEVRRLNQQRAHERRLREAAERRNVALQAEMELRTAAARAGVQDIDYAIELLRRKVKSMTEAELEAFDENAYFKTELRKSHPILYGAVEAPAHTAPAAEDPPPDPKDKPSDPGATPLDARKMTREQFQDQLRKMKIKDPSLGV